MVERLSRISDAAEDNISERHSKKGWAGIILVLILHAIAHCRLIIELGTNSKEIGVIVVVDCDRYFRNDT